METKISAIDFLQGNAENGWVGIYDETLVTSFTVSKCIDGVKTKAQVKYFNNKLPELKKEIIEIFGLLILSISFEVCGLAQIIFKAELVAFGGLRFLYPAIHEAALKALRKSLAEKVLEKLEKSASFFKEKYYASDVEIRCSFDINCLSKTISEKEIFFSTERAKEIFSKKDVEFISISLEHNTINFSFMLKKDTEKGDLINLVSSLSYELNGNQDISYCNILEDKL